MIPLRWAPGDKAVVRVEVRRIEGKTEGVVAILETPSGTWTGLPVRDLQISPLVADDPRVVELVAAARLALDELQGMGFDRSSAIERRLANALEALGGQR